MKVKLNQKVWLPEFKQYGTVFKVNHLDEPIQVRVNGKIIDVAGKVVKAASFLVRILNILLTVLKPR